MMMMRRRRSRGLFHSERQMGGCEEVVRACVVFVRQKKSVEEGTENESMTPHISIKIRVIHVI